jgi:hypothetical protein
MALSTGDDAGAGAGLTDWLNGYAAYVAGELIPSDVMLGWHIKPPSWNTEQAGVWTSSRVQERYSAARNYGIWKSKHEFQTCQFLFWLMQTTGTPTTEGTPVGYNTHALTIGNVSTPDWHGIHFEREGITSNELRYDLAGLLPSDLVINCGASAENYKATQEITIPFAYLKRDASDIAAQTPRDTGATGSITKDWSHAITGNGVGDAPSGLTYNTAQLEVNIIDMSLKFHRDFMFGPGSSSATAAIRGTPLYGYLFGWDYSIELEVKPIGDLLYTVNNTKKEDYAGDLDYDFYFTADATNDSIRFNYDKLYMVPFDEVNDYNKWNESYKITLEPFDKTSLVTVTGIDNLDNTHFENP